MVAYFPVLQKSDNKSGSERENPFSLSLSLNSLPPPVCIYAVNLWSICIFYCQGEMKALAFGRVGSFYRHLVITDEKERKQDCGQ